jgi:hypothetical protein
MGQGIGESMVGTRYPNLITGFVGPNPHDWLWQIGPGPGKHEAASRIWWVEWLRSTRTIIIKTIAIAHPTC